MKNQGKTSWLFATLVSLSALFVSGAAYCGDPSECLRMCSAKPAAHGQATTEIDWLSSSTSDMACKIESPLSAKTWVDWDSRFEKELHRNQMASNGSGVGNRQPARSNN